MRLALDVLIYKHLIISVVSLLVPAERLPAAKVLCLLFLEYIIFLASKLKNSANDRLEDI